jgi:type II secretory pathway component PulC
MNSISEISKKIFLSLVLIGITIISYTQSFALHALNGKTWSLQGLNNQTYTETFKKDKIILSQNGKYFGTMEYYLSDSIEYTFNPSKVGKIKEGKFIIRRPVRDEGNVRQRLTVKYYEILSLDSKNLAIKNSKDQELHFNRK